jgi:bifunctional non-homologous end joining protein LigD
MLACSSQTPVVPSKRKGVRWVKPTLAAEIEFREWTKDGKLRHASLKGLREEADIGEVYSVG